MKILLFYVKKNNILLKIGFTRIRSIRSFRLSILLLGFSEFLLMSNGWNDNTPPKGEDTFSCYINGKLFCLKII